MLKTLETIERSSSNDIEKYLKKANIINFDNENKYIRSNHVITQYNILIWFNIKIIKSDCVVSKFEI